MRCMHGERQHELTCRAIFWVNSIPYPSSWWTSVASITFRIQLEIYICHLSCKRKCTSLDTSILNLRGDKQPSCLIRRDKTKRNVHWIYWYGLSLYNLSLVWVPLLLLLLLFSFGHTFKLWGLRELVFNFFKPHGLKVCPH